MPSANAVNLSSLSRKLQATPAEVLPRPALQLLSGSTADPILQALPAAVILLDQRGIVYQANPAALAMLAEPLLGQAWFNVISRCFRPRSDDGLEVSLKDGRRVKLQISTVLSHSDYTQPGQLIMLTDLTETRQLQSRLSHLQRLSTLGKMMATLAHQIRTPLSAALLYAHRQGDAQALRLRIERSGAGQTEVWHDEHPMVAVGFVELQALLQPYFDVHVFEHDYQKLIPWDGVSGNALFACVKR